MPPLPADKRGGQGVVGKMKCKNCGHPIERVPKGKEKIWGCKWIHKVSIGYGAAKVCGLCDAKEKCGMLAHPNAQPIEVVK